MTLKVGILNAIDPQLSQIDWNKTPVDGYRRFFDNGAKTNTAQPRSAEVLVDTRLTPGANGA